MPSSVVTVQVGQCGNQLGMEYWKRMCNEHGIGLRGETVSHVESENDRKEVFFNEANFGQKYVPRAVLVDLEPRVLSEITAEDSFCYDLFNPNNIFEDPTGGGAGNIWGRGYKQPEEVVNAIYDIITSEVERADNLDSLAMIHSIMGGTGSGLGSRILQEYYERFPKTIVHTFSVMSPLYPDVNVAPYNVVPSLDIISKYTDFTVLFDNDAFYRYSQEGQGFRFKDNHDNFGKKNYAQINSMMSQIMASLSAPIRYYNPVYSRMMNVAGQLNSFPPLQFIQPSFTPFEPLNLVVRANRPITFQNTRPILSHITNPNQLISSVTQILQNLAQKALRRNNSEVNIQQSQPTGRSAIRCRTPSGSGGTRHSVDRPDVDNSEKGLQETPKKPITNDCDNFCLISGLGIIRIDKSLPNMEKSSSLAPMKHATLKAPEYSCPPWLHNSSTMSLTKTLLSPYMDHSLHPVTGLLLANHSSILVPFSRMVHTYNEQRRSKAFLNNYEAEGVVEQMDSARDSLDSIVKLYKEINTMEFLTH